jgi:hypothetical protein
MRKKGKNIGGWFILRSVGNKAVDILFVMGNDRKSLPDELVGNSNDGDFPRLAVRPQSVVTGSAFLVASERRTGGNIELASQGKSPLRFM